MLSSSPKEQRSNESTAVAREEEFERERGLESVAPHERVHRGLERVEHQRGKGRGARDELVLLLAVVDLFGLRESRETTQSARDAVQRVRLACPELKPRVQASLEQQRIQSGWSFHTGNLYSYVVHASSYCAQYSIYTSIQFTSTRMCVG